MLNLTRNNQEKLTVPSRVAGFVLATLVLLNSPALSLDSENSAVQNVRDDHLLHGAVDQVQRGQQGSTGDTSLRIPRPSAELINQRAVSTRAQDNPKNPPLLDVNQPLNVRPPLLTVQDSHHTNQEGLGLLGMYALCTDVAGTPYYITNVFPTSELKQYGVESGDFLTRINNASPFEYMHSVHPIKPGATITLTFEHHGIPKTVSARLMNFQTFTPFLESYSQWATSHISFLTEHQGQYHSCGLF